MEGKNRHVQIPVMSLSLLSVLFLCAIPSLVAGEGKEDGSRKIYIINVQPPTNSSVSTSGADLVDYYKSFLPKTQKSGDSPRLVHSYTRVFSGFAARLTAEELAAVEKLDGVIRAFPDVELQLHTTHSPDFLGLRPGGGLWRFGAPGQGEGMIVGVLDSGFTPGHPSFGDNGMPAPPARWRGSCTDPQHCNRKVIGARDFTGSGSVVDINGHGTHTSSTAAGNFVPGANEYGNAAGTAAGLAPRAHLAIYKVCPSGVCPTNAVIAGIDAAVADGVDVISMSLGSPSVSSYDNQPIAIAAFGAMRNRVFFSASAGNNGNRNVISNDAAWMLTVAASTIDRSVRATVRLGNGQEFNGESVNQGFPTTTAALVYPGATIPNAATCEAGSLAGIDVSGRIVICDVGGFSGAVAKGQTVQNAGGAGMIVANVQLQGNTISDDPHVLPASAVSHTAGLAIKAYAASAANPVATILFRGTVLGALPAPVVAYFSSRGPSLQNRGILKPDITGPGVNILAAWNAPVGPTNFNMISGTSMSTPHLSGIAALLKGFHPTWSPAAIRSAIMTTSETLDRSGSPIRNEFLNPANIFDMGAGHVSPNSASNPGLVYDLDASNYLPFLCGLGYNDGQVSAINGNPVSCGTVGSVAEWNLNYPAITVSGLGLPATVTRTVTNVGWPLEFYWVQVDAPPGVSVTVSPSKLLFWFAGQRLSYTVTIRQLAQEGAAGLGNKTAAGGIGAAANWPGNPNWVFGKLEWVSLLKHVVRSPIAVAL